MKHTKEYADAIKTIEKGLIHFPGTPRCTCLPRVCVHVCAVMCVCVCLLFCRIPLPVCDSNAWCLALLGACVCVRHAGNADFRKLLAEVCLCVGGRRLLPSCCGLPLSQALRPAPHFCLARLVSVPLSCLVFAPLSCLFLSCVSCRVQLKTLFKAAEAERRAGMARDEALKQEANDLFKVGVAFCVIDRGGWGRNAYHSLVNVSARHFCCCTHVGLLRLSCVVSFLCCCVFFRFGLREHRPLDLRMPSTSTQRP